MDDSCTVIAVNGQDGDCLAKTRLQGSDYARALVRYSGTRQGRNGAHGHDAAAPINGSPGGSLSIEISESAEHEGYIHAAVVQWQGTTQPAMATDIPSRRTILLSASGGHGEAGRNGGDGEGGIAGINGLPATKDSDAQDGIDGGDGGDAGSGTDGGNGGDGGAIQILLDAHHTHLLFAVDWNVAGGDGGPAGNHGNAGEGGKGGTGGERVEWKQFLGYKYYCTSSCVGKNTDAAASSSAALVSVNTSLARTGTRLRSAIGSELVRGGDLQSMVAAAAARYHARSERRIDHGNCKCAGGYGNCQGCEYQAIETTFRRPPGQSGKQGHDGQRQSTILRTGLPGLAGQVTIVVRNEDNTITEYSERWKLRLVSFDIEDENGDGIFEPGENVIVRRICIENTGGMPSPLQGIELRIQPSEHLVLEPQAKCLIPSSIAPKSALTLEGFLCARIAKPGVIHVGEIFKKPGVNISLIATIPWLDCALPGFAIERSFDVRYPCGISNIDILASVSPGSSSNFELQITNYSNKMLGCDAASPRGIEVVASIPSRYATFESELTSTVDGADEVPVAVTCVKPKAEGTVSQVLHVLPDTQAPSRFPLTLLLYIADCAAADTPSTEEESEVNLILVQQVQVTVNVSWAYHHNPSADLVMVISSQTPPWRIMAVRQFAEKHLGMQVDCLDVNLNGGLHVDQSVESDVFEESADPNYIVHLFTKYDGKLILLFGECFPFLDTKQSNIAKLCDSRQIRRCLTTDTSVLIFSQQDGASSRELFQQVVFDLPQQHQEASSSALTSATFDDFASLANAVAQQKRHGNHSTISFILQGKKRRWYDLLDRSVENQATSVARKLRKALPQARFLISPAPKVSRTSEVPSHSGHMVVLLGADLNVPLRKTEPRDAPAGSLAAFEQYSIIAALPSARRAQQVWSDVTGRNEQPPLCLEAAICSLAIDCITEINNYAYSKLLTGCAQLAAQTCAEIQDHLSVHLPTVQVVLSPPGSSAIVPSAVREVLEYCLCTCRAQSMRQTLAEKAVLGITRRRKLGRYLEKIIGSYTAGLDISLFRQSVKAMRSENIACLHLVVTRAARLTKISEHAFMCSVESSADVVPSSQVCTAEEWDSRLKASQATWKRIEDCEQRAVQTLRRRLTVAER